MIDDHETKLKYLVAAKLIVITCAALGQLYLLKKLLSKSDKGYQPVWIFWR